MNRTYPPYYLNWQSAKVKSTKLALAIEKDFCQYRFRKKKYFQSRYRPGMRIWSRIRIHFSTRLLFQIQMFKRCINFEKGPS
jgi:hypothetical protein